jgi:hypothetical protein
MLYLATTMPIMHDYQFAFIFICVLQVLFL